MSQPMVGDLQWGRPERVVPDNPHEGEMGRVSYLGGAQKS